MGKLGEVKRVSLQGDMVVIRDLFYFILFYFIFFFWGGGRSIEMGIMGGESSHLIVDSIDSDCMTLRAWNY